MLAVAMIYPIRSVLLQMTPYSGNSIWIPRRHQDKDASLNLIFLRTRQKGAGDKFFRSRSRSGEEASLDSRESKY